MCARHGARLATARAVRVAVLVEEGRGITNVYRKWLCVVFVWGEWEEVESGGDGGGAGVWAAGVSDVSRVLTDNVA